MSCVRTKEGGKWRERGTSHYRGIEIINTMNAIENHEMRNEYNRGANDRDESTAVDFE